MRGVLHLYGLIVPQLLHDILVFLSQSPLFSEIDSFLVPTIFLESTHQHGVFFGVGHPKLCLLQLGISGDFLHPPASISSFLTIH